LPTETRSARPSRFRLVAAFAIVTLAGILYADTLGAPYVLDDVRNIVGNPAVRCQRLDLECLRRAAFESPTPRAVANVSFALNYYHDASDSRGYRIVNIAIHALNGVLVFALALAVQRRLAVLAGGAALAPGAGILALFAGLLFVAHPLQTQSVAYLVQRMNSLATSFYLLAFLAWLCGREAGRVGPRLTWWAACGFAWALAVGSKENAVVLPFAVWLYEWTFYRDFDRAWLRRTAPLLLIGVAALAVVLFVHSGGLARFEGRAFTLGQRLLTQLRALWIYIGLVLLPLPSRLNLLYELPLSTSLWQPISTLLGGIGLAGLLAVAVALGRRWRLGSFAIAWFLLHLALESSVLPLAMIFEHRTYLPLVGVAIAVPASIASVLGTGRVAWGVCAALVIALGVGTHIRNQVWLDAATLWTDVVAKSPHSARAHDELGLVLAGAERWEEAIFHYREAIRLDPPKPDAYLHLGYALVRLEAPEEGERWMRRALEIDPDNAAAHHVLGLVLVEADRLQEATPHLERAVELEPGRAEMHNTLGIALDKQGRTDEARRRYDEALRWDPRFAQAHTNLGVMSARAGAAAAALAHFSAALRLDPASTAARNNLAWILATSPDPELRDAARAVALAEDARREQAADPDVLDTLAVAYAAAGRFDEAARTADQAAGLAASVGNDAGAEQIRARARLYRQGRPYLEGPR
jgi:Flp pilus assembly protein TadD